MSAISGSTPDLKRVVAAMAKMGKTGARSVTKALAEEAIRQLKLGFREGRSPRGSAWKPLQTRSGQPLRKTGRLQNSFTREVRGELAFVIGTNVIYAATHQYGAEIKPVRAKMLAFQVSK